MGIRSIRYTATLVLSGAIFTILVGISSVWFLRHLGWVLGTLAPSFGLDADTVGTIREIFDQLLYAELNLPLVPTGVICFLFCGLAILILCRHRKKAVSDTILTEEAKPKKAGRIVLVVILGILLFLPLTALTVWFTEVNDIRFDRVMQSLLPLLGSGLI